MKTIVRQSDVGTVHAHRRNNGRLRALGAAVHVSRELAVPELARSGDGVSRKRRLIAAFCRMLGEQLMDAKPPLMTREPLSRRQRQTLELLLSGNAEKQIAAHLSISRHTVHVYVK